MTSSKPFLPPGVTADRYGLVGSEGYSTPPLHELRELGFEDIRAGAVPNLTVAGSSAGRGNRVFAHPETNLRSNLTIEVDEHTSNSSIIIGANCTLFGTVVSYGQGNVIILSGGASPIGHFGQIYARLWGPGNCLFIGLGSTSNVTSFDIAGNGNAVVVGDDCMFAERVRINNTDHHGIMDIATRQWRNPPADIVIEPHVWLADDVTVLKGVVVGLGSVAANKSLVARSIPRSTVAGGVPAKPITTDICWDRNGVPAPSTVDEIEDFKRRVPPFTQEGLKDQFTI